jgi:ribosome-associated protein
MKDITPELRFSAVRSSGPGGQNVNKTASKVEVRFNVEASVLLTDTEKALIREKLANQLTQESELVVTAQTERSQLRNKEIAVQKLVRLLNKAFAKPKARKATKPTAASQQERREQKSRQSEKKAQRQRKDWQG